MLFLYSLFLLLIIWLQLSGMCSVCIGLGKTTCLSFDSSSLIFLFTLSIISLCVILWAYYYLDSVALFRTFFGLVLWFLFAIVGLILSGSLHTLLVFWDLLGFSSFFLVLFYRSRASVSGAILTGVTNRFGDVMLLSFLCFYMISGSVSVGAASFFLLLGAFTKSAQVPFRA